MRQPQTRLSACPAPAGSGDWNSCRAEVGRRWMDPWGFALDSALRIPHSAVARTGRWKSTTSNQIQPNPTGKKFTRTRRLAINLFLRPASGYSGLIRVKIKKLSSHSRADLGCRPPTDNGQLTYPAYFQRIKVNQSKTRYFLYPRGPGRPRERANPQRTTDN